MTSQSQVDIHSQYSVLLPVSCLTKVLGFSSVVLSSSVFRLMHILHQNTLISGAQNRLLPEQQAVLDLDFPLTLHKEAVCRECALKCIHRCVQMFSTNQSKASKPMASSSSGLSQRVLRKNNLGCVNFFSSSYHRPTFFNSCCM